MFIEDGEPVAPGVHRVGARLEDLTPGARVTGVMGARDVTVVAVQWHDLTDPLRFLLADDPGAGKTIMIGSTSRS